MLYDPIDAFFRGVSSSLVRVPLTFAPLLLVLACYSLPNGDLGLWALAGFPFVIIGVIIAWATKGVIFFLGFLAFFAYLIAAWRFIQTDYPKEHFLVLLISAFVLFLPLAWDEGDRAFTTYSLAGGLFLTFIFCGYVLPAILERLFKSKNA
jgi:hypothetical protein